MNFSFEDKVIIITGASRGIGKEIASEFASAGAKVMLLATTLATLENTVKQIKDAGGKAFGYVANVADAAAIEALFNQIVHEHGKIDVLINNAGITRDNLLIRMKEEDWDRVLQINLKGAFICTQKAFKHMMRTRQGSIINISSVIGLMGNAGQTNYAASKGGLIAFTKSCAKEFAGRNIRVNAIAPGFIETEMTATLSAEVRGEYAKMIPLARMGSGQDVAQSCLFLASDYSKYITGQTIAVDGGLTMQ